MPPDTPGNTPVPEQASTHMTSSRENEQASLGVHDDAQRQAHRHDHDTDALRRFVVETARLLDDRHCEDIVIFDVHGLSQLTDYIIIATGTSDRQMKAVAGDVADLGKQHGLERYGSERDDSSTWIVIDFVEVMVHLFEPATRGHYDLEMMWGDAEKVDWRRDRTDA